MSDQTWRRNHFTFVSSWLTSLHAGEILVQSGPSESNDGKMEE